jgi:hypothetical protein
MAVTLIVMVDNTFVENIENNKDIALSCLNLMSFFLAPKGRICVNVRENHDNITKEDLSNKSNQIFTKC